jgi:hypothetical protein
VRVAFSGEYTRFDNLDETDFAAALEPQASGDF